MPTRPSPVNPEYICNIVVASLDACLVSGDGMVAIAALTPPCELYREATLSGLMYRSYVFYKFCHCARDLIP